MPRLRLRHAFVAVIVTLAMLAQGTWALAGTTGNITGSLTDSTNGRPVADAHITAVSPSQSASATTDAGGHFTFLSLAPDTYTVSADKSGYAPISVAGVTVFADQTQTLALTTHPELKTIARVTSRAAANLVKPGVTSDTYSVNSAAAQAAAPLGGGGNMENAYSAIASVPGVNVPVGGAGWNNNAVFIRGNQSFFTSFEYDGVPVNRAFDNYNSSTESNLGLQELQVYTGGGPASNSSAGTSGFINQVIKTGTYPGFGTATGGLAAPTFFHSLRVEAGGASPNRNFSYYVGIAGTNQNFDIFDRSNGTSLTNLGGELDFFPQFTSHNFFTAPPGTTGRGVWPICQPGTNMPPAAVASLPWWASTQGPNGSCFIYDQPAWLISSAQPAYISDRENVVNLHFGIPHPNGLRDDVQVLWSASALGTDYNSSANDAGGVANYTLAVTGSPYCPMVQPAAAPGYCFSSTGAYVPNYPSYIDAGAVYNLPFGTPIQTNGVPLPTTSYLQPSSPQNRLPLAQLPANLRDTIHNDTGIVKIQYTKALSSSAYVRLFGYTFFSDWTQAGANSAFNCYDFGIGGPADCNVAANYDLITHTGGGEFQIADQISPQHLLQLTSNYTTATVSRFNNTGYINSFFFGGSFVGYVSHANGVYTCYDPNPTNPDGTPNPDVGQPVGCRPGSGSPFWSVAGAGPYPTAPAGTPAAAAGAQWITLQNGNTYGTFNTVKPKFLFTSLTDEFRPNDKWDFNVGLRWDRYEYDLAPLTPGTDFYAQIVSQDVCQNATGQVLTFPLQPGQPPPAPVNYTATCPSGYAHPAFSPSSPSSYLLNALSPRGQFTYTVDPLTVIRGEVGRYTQPPITASVQYLNSSGNALTVWNATLPLGFHTPFHPIPLMSSIQSDLSFEHQFRGTQISAKLSPFFNYTNAYQQQAFIGPNFVTQVPVGQFRSYGVEAALSDGDVNREGLSGTLAFTWTQAQVHFSNQFYGSNQLDGANQAISNYNALTKSGGGSPCYTAAIPPNPTTGAPGVPGTPTSCATAGAILNPYYNSPAQPFIDTTAWYAPGSTGLSPTNNVSTFYFDSPLVGSLILNYKHSRFAITPSFQISEGSSYGGPFDVTGMDPRACAANATVSGITAASPNTNPNQCNYLTLFAGNVSPTPVAGQLFIPNPATGKFSTPGQFRNPWLAMLNLQLRYDFSPKITGIITLADVWHTCFGGQSEPWTKAFPPSANVCSYYYNANYVSNFYNGTSPTDVAANGLPAQTWLQQPYVPAYGLSVGSGNPFPFNAFFQLQVKL